MESQPSHSAIIALCDHKRDRLTPELVVSFYSAAIALEDRAAQATLISLADRVQLTGEQLYEIILQSYLFLGYPRMITAAEILRTAPATDSECAVAPYSAAEGVLWAERGESTMRQVYGSVFEQLRDRALYRYPEIFRWMLVEGYGKVIARPGLALPLREIATVSFLIVEGRDATLYSHVRGALLVGVPMAVLRGIVADLTPAAPIGAALATRHLDTLETAA